ncbi:hypothetical protein BGX38DRAFT_1157598 [Terfezia claveryi]|nr:hypothetical protein BGX38DRAFT_1157598 [Terfezia claveryi]
MQDVKSSLKNLDHKFDKRFDDVNRKFDDVNKKIDRHFERMVLLVLGGVLLKGGIDFFQDQHKNSTSRKEV